jgi:hypothetical protein
VIKRERTPAITDDLGEVFAPSEIQEEEVYNAV